ncbi:MAG: DUF421 domain-containing protein [Sphingobacteriales bacterium]|nr:MAG: DUF421 domain-containing protein [Sphingobacteriales bacterium]
MKKEEIHLFDYSRILIGNAPVEFLLEVLIRTILIYVAAIIAIRLLGKRMSGQISITEMAVMILMGAIIAPAAQIPERGILAGATILLCVLILNRAVNFLGIRKPKLEKLTQGNLSMLVKDGMLQQEEMRKTNIPNQQLFAELRAKKLYNLGMVKRVYLEAGGQFSIYKFEVQRPGLALFPPNDQKMMEATSPIDSKLTCCNCGNVIPGTPTPGECTRCGHNDWTRAIIYKNNIL